MAEHWCKEHQTAWFHKGRMKGYAHPIKDENGEDTREWCNEPESEGKVTQADTKPEYAPQEIGMWWNNLGNRIGDGSLERDFPKMATKIKGHYYQKMSKVTGVSFKEQDSQQ